MALRRALRPTVALALGVTAATLAACGDQGGGDEEAACAPADSTVTVRGLDSLKFDADDYEAEAGCVEFRYVNDGNVAHTLLVEGHEFELTIGDTDEGALELPAGTYRIYCDIAGHVNAGMEAELTVS